MSAPCDDGVAAGLAQALDLPENPACLPLDGWGSCDRHWRLPSGWYVLLEVERSQKHPSTNVAKIWPWLEEHGEARALLIHYFFEWSPGRASSRGRIAAWLGARMQRDLAGRFLYCGVVEARPSMLEALRATVDRLRC